MLKDTQDTDPGFLRERLSMLALRYSGDIKVQRESYARLRVMGGKAKTVIVEELVDQDFAVSRFGSSAGPLGVWKAGGNHEVSRYGHSFFCFGVLFILCKGCSFHCEKRVCGKQRGESGVCKRGAARQQRDELGATALAKLACRTRVRGAGVGLGQVGVNFIEQFCLFVFSFVRAFLTRRKSLCTYRNYYLVLANQLFDLVVYDVDRTWGSVSPRYIGNATDWPVQFCESLGGRNIFCTNVMDALGNQYPAQIATLIAKVLPDPLVNVLHHFFCFCSKILF